MEKKVLIVLLADKSTHENMGRALHALLYAKQAVDAGSAAEIIFDGGGTEWAADFPKNEHFKKLYEELLAAGVIKGVCTFCSKAFNVEEELQHAQMTFLDEDGGHPNISKRVLEGWIPLIL